MRKLILSIISACMLGSSCTLDVTPENAVTFVSYFKTEQDFETVVYQMHSFMKSARGIPAHQYVGVVADYMKQGGPFINLKNMNYDTYSSYFYNDWKELYDVIYLANVIIDNSFRSEILAKERLDFYLGQANFCKGIMYLNLSQNWGEAVITTDSNNQKPYAKSSIIDVVNEAIRCGLEAFGQLPLYEKMYDSSGAVIESKQFGNQGSVAALLAHAYAWKGSMIELYNVSGESAEEAYCEAVYWATELIEGRVGSTYGIYSNPLELVKKGLKGTLDGNKSMESVFELETDLEAGDATNLYSLIKTPQGWPYNPEMSSHAIHYRDIQFGVTPVLLEQMYDKTNDGRLPAFFSDGRFIPATENTPESYPETWETPGADIQMAFPRKLRDPKYEANKWSGDMELRTYKANCIYWRLSDIILLRAECNVKLGETGAAISDLNRIRDRAGATSYPASGETDLKLAIFKEREKELIFEGHRFYDAVRNGADYVRTHIGYGYANLSDSDIQQGALFMPIPAAAFKRNDLMRQNLYWLPFENL